MNRSIPSISLAVVLALAALGASAQTAAPAPAASGTATVGVTPQEAAEANRKAVPRSDTGTVVRTTPSPAARASTAVTPTMPAVTPTMPAATGSSMAGTTRPMRKARADRN